MKGKQKTNITNAKVISMNRLLYTGYRVQMLPNLTLSFHGYIHGFTVELLDSHVVYLTGEL
jgi:hypothetical protein